MGQAYINDRTTDFLSLKSSLLKGSSRQQSVQFDVLNLHLRRGLVTPGQRVIIPDDDGVACTANDAWLMRLCRILLGIATKGKGELFCGIVGGATGGSSLGTGSGIVGAEVGDLMYEFGGLQ
ncbi:hypothetical protein [Pseudomonas mucidolens]|uniref:hypothetical protein n=1 Tax=Pseudomonas mucidolens TaxID=46679 RepID=UPI003BB54E99